MTTSGDGKGPKRPRSFGGAVLGGFVLGAACVLLIVWLYGGGFPPGAPEAETPVPAPSRPGASLPAPAPALPPANPQDPGASPPWSAPATPASATSRSGACSSRSRATGRGSFKTPSRIPAATGGSTTRSTSSPPANACGGGGGGRIAKLFQSDLGGLTIYQYDPWRPTPTTTPTWNGMPTA